MSATINYQKAGTYTQDNRKYGDDDGRISSYLTVSTTTEPLEERGRGLFGAIVAGMLTSGIVLALAGLAMWRLNR